MVSTLILRSSSSSDLSQSEAMYFGNYVYYHMSIASLRSTIHILKRICIFIIIIIIIFFRRISSIEKYLFNLQILRSGFA